MKILAIDHGIKFIGIAISDETGTLARPLETVSHHSKLLDAALIAQIAIDNSVEKIIIGVSYDEDGDPNRAGRQAINFSELLKTQIDKPVELWDESFTTQDARAVRIASGAPRKKRSGHLDDVAAAVLLQNFLDIQNNSYEK